MQHPQSLVSHYLRCLAFLCFALTNRPHSYYILLRKKRLMIIRRNCWTSHHHHHLFCFEKLKVDGSLERNCHCVLGLDISPTLPLLECFSLTMCVVCGLRQTVLIRAAQSIAIESKLLRTYNKTSSLRTCSVGLCSKMDVIV